MPISKKIVEKIQNLNVDENFKVMMLDILRDEDSGVYRFKAEYEKHVNDYLAKEKGEGGQND